MISPDIAPAVLRADERIRDAILRTPLEPVPALGRAAKARVFIKWECDQRTGSFKLRGALNALRSLNAAERGRGVVSASTGNHGLAMIHAAHREGVRLMLFVPLSIAPGKRDKLRAAGADLVIAGASCEQAERMARAEAAAAGRIYISPYNDLRVVAGQGTIGLEIAAAACDADDVLVPVGGGGLAAGIGGVLKALRPKARVWGVEPARSAFMAASFAAGRLVGIAEKPTLADAVAGGIEPGAITFDLCRAFLAGILQTSESAIRRAMRILERLHGRPVEGAGALALAAFAARPEIFRGRTVVLVVSGGNAPAGPDRGVAAASRFE
ncbi:MAG: pyridoxal-phosphate dependent enzyme [Acidobacteriota bacterium]|nr:pyridoxal-phosphate dependent enzyme [Acidobacteriota bacterium]